MVGRGGSKRQKTVREQQYKKYFFKKGFLFRRYLRVHYLLVSCCVTAGEVTLCPQKRKLQRFPAFFLMNTKSLALDKLQTLYHFRNKLPPLSTARSVWTPSEVWCHQEDVVYQHAGC